MFCRQPNCRLHPPVPDVPHVGPGQDAGIPRAGVAGLQLPVPRRTARPAAAAPRPVPRSAPLARPVHHAGAPAQQSAVSAGRGAGVPEQPVRGGGRAVEHPRRRLNDEAGGNLERGQLGNTGGAWLCLYKTGAGAVSVWPNLSEVLFSGGSGEQRVFAKIGISPNSLASAALDILPNNADKHDSSALLSLTPPCADTSGIPGCRNSSSWRVWSGTAGTERE